MECLCGSKTCTELKSQYVRHSYNDHKIYSMEDKYLIVVIIMQIM